MAFSSFYVPSKRAWVQFKDRRAITQLSLISYLWLLSTYRHRKVNQSDDQTNLKFLGGLTPLINKKMKQQELRTKLTGDSAFDKQEEHFLVWDHQVGRATLQHRLGHLYHHFHHNHRHHHHDNHRHHQLPPGGWDEVQAWARL